MVTMVGNVGDAMRLAINVPAWKSMVALTDSIGGGELLMVMMILSSSNVLAAAWANEIVGVSFGGIVTTRGVLSSAKALFVAATLRR